MEDKRLDNIIGDKLGDFEIPYQSSSWDALADKLNEADATERFDESIRRKLSDIELSYQPLYWDMLAQRLEQENTFRKQLIRYKATELLLVFLILITFVQVFPNQGMRNILPFGNKGISEELNVTAKASNEINTYKSSVDVDKVNFNVTTNFPTSISVSEIESHNTNNTARSISPTTFAGQDFINVNQLDASLALLEVKTANASLPVTISEFNQLNGGEESTSTFFILTEPMATQSITLLEDQAASLPEAEKTIRRWRVGMIASSNVDHIQTPYDEIFGLAPISRLDLGGYSGGVTVSKEWKRWEVETGVIYSHKKYESRDPYFYYGNISDGYSVEGVKNIEFNTIQIPVNVSYDLAQQEKWHFYALGGASVNVAIVANYDVEKVRAGAINVSNNIFEAGGLLTELSENQERLFDEKSTHASEPESNRLKQRKFANGVFNGGKYKENSYYTLNLGFGMERRFDDRVSVFLQPTFRQHMPFLSGRIGPYEDRISTLNLLIGAKIGF
ncbi:MAG: hypothetical protein AAF806_18375 [Bacteroidota bacterium]